MMPTIRMFARKMEQWVLLMFRLLAGCHGLLHGQQNMRDASREPSLFVVWRHASQDGTDREMIWLYVRRRANISDLSH
jgi:hypothetical protein